MHPVDGQHADVFSLGQIGAPGYKPQSIRILGHARRQRQVLLTGQDDIGRANDLGLTEREQQFAFRQFALFGHQSRRVVQNLEQEDGKDEDGHDRRTEECAAPQASLSAAPHHILVGLFALREKVGLYLVGDVILADHSYTSRKRRTIR